MRSFIIYLILLQQPPAFSRLTTNPFNLVKDLYRCRIFTTRCSICHSPNLYDVITQRSFIIINWVLTSSIGSLFAEAGDVAFLI